jgi:hypothetical protein
MMAKNLGDACSGIEHIRSPFSIGGQIGLKLLETVLASWLIAGILTAGMAQAETCPGTIDCGSQNAQFSTELREALDFFNEIGGAYSKANDALNVINTVARVLDLIDKEEKVSDLTKEELISSIKAELDKAIGVVEWELSYQFYADRYGEVHGALIGARTAQDLHEALDRNSPRWQSSIDAVDAAGAPGLFMRHLNSAETSTKSRWMEIIPDKPKPDSNGLILDWRLALPAYLQLVALRLQVIALVDPTFRTAVAFGTKSESAYRAELKPIRDTMERLLGIGTEGNKQDSNWQGSIQNYFKCGTKPAEPVFLIGNKSRFTARVACADINTGIYVEYDPEVVYTVNSEATFIEAKRAFSDELVMLRRNLQYSLESLTPIFDLKSFRNTLSLYLDTSLRDLTEPNHLIRSDDSGSCLILIDPIIADPNSDAGFAISARIGLGSCNSPYARWTYDRASGLITNESVDQLSRYWGGNGACLRAVLWDVLAPNIPVGVEDCGIASNEDPTGRTIKWTYDPNARTLISGAGGFLSWANLSDQNGASIGPGPLLVRPDLDSPDRSSTPTPSTQWGSMWTCSDVAIVKGLFGKRSGQTSFDPRADVNGDGVLDVKDLGNLCKSQLQ